jgi:cephalosporin hydroxylase
MNTLGSYRGLACHHHDEELPLIAAVLREVRPRYVIEAGTMHGGFAAFLADTVAEWKGQVLTIDIEVQAGLQEALAGRPNLYFLSGDIFSPFIGHILRNLSLEARGALAFYADAGQGRAELFVYGTLGRLVGVHDYTTSVDAVAAEAWAAEKGLVPFHREAFEALEQTKGGYFVSRFWIGR